MKNWGIFFSLWFFVLSCQKKMEFEPMFSENWTSSNQLKLSEIIAHNAHNGKVAIFDFDNTTLCRDIGEATMAQLEMDSLLFFSESLAAISPQLGNPDVKSVSGYYDALLHLEPNSHTNAYLWAAQSLSGLNLRQIIEATKRVMDKGEASFELNKTQAFIVGDFPVPYIYPEMVELYAVLIRNGIEPFVVSASNIWSVRYTVLKYLNPKISAKNGMDSIVKPENVFGIHFWLRDKRDNKLYKDEYLLKTNVLYAQMDYVELENYVITNLPVLPVTAYGGKLALIYEKIGKIKPLLVAGDSPNDFLMLSIAEYKLWIARMEKPDYLEAFFEEFKDEKNIILQPVLNSYNSGFYGDTNALIKLSEKHAKILFIKKSVELLH